MFWPVIHEPAGDASHTAAAPQSVGVPRRRIGMRTAVASNWASVTWPTVFVASVGTVPGEMQFERMPFGPSSVASVSASEFMPDFAAP